MSRAWNIEGLMAVRTLAACGAPLGHIGYAIDRPGADVDQALWALVGRTPDQALQRLNGWGSHDLQDPDVLGRRVLALLTARPIEVAVLASILGAPEQAVSAALHQLAEAGLVDAQDPPPPCDRRQLGWFALPGAVA